MSSLTSPSRRRSTAIQFVGNLVLMGLAIVQGLILIPLYLAHIGQDLYGAWLATASTVALLGMADFGVTGIASQRSGAYCGVKDWSSLGAFIVTLFVFDCGVSVIIGTTGLVLAEWLPAWVGIIGPLADSLSAAIRIVVLDIILMLFVSISGALLFGLQKPAAHMMGMILGTALGIVATVIMLLKGWGVIALAAGSLARPLVALPINVYALASALKHKLNRPMLRLDPGQLRDFLRAAAWLGPAKTAETLIPQVNNIIVIKILGPAAVTILSLTGKVSDIIVQIIGRLPASFLSGLAHLYGSGEVERYREIVRSLFCTIIYLGMIGIAAVLVFNADFVKLWVGADFYGGDILNVLICTYALMKILRITLYNIMLSRYEIRVTSLASMAEATIQVGAGVIFAFIWGVNGVVLASIVAVTIASVIQGKALLPILRFRVEHTTLKIVRLFSIVALPSGLVILVERLWATDSWAKLLLYATGYAIVGAILIVCAEPRLFVQIKNILQRKPVGV